MQYLVLGAGRMGRAIAYDLARSEGPSSVAVADKDGSRAEELGRELGIRGYALDFHDEAETAKRLAEANVAVSAADYSLNELLTRLAIREGTHLCDLGGNEDVVARQLALHQDARNAGVTIIPDCGLAPGLACLIAVQAASEVAEPRRVAIRVGGLPVRPKPPLNYALFFSVKGLINEYIEPVEVLRNGRRAMIEPLTEVEEIDFGPELGALEAFSTSGGVSTLPSTWEGKILELDYKTIRYAGHARIMRAMLELGFFRDEPVMHERRPVSPRAVSEAVLERALSHDEEDVVLVRVTASGPTGDVSYQLVDRRDPQTGHSAMMRTTGYPTAAIARFLAQGLIGERGVVPGERCVPVPRLLEELRRRGIDIQRTTRAHR